MNYEQQVTESLSQATAKKLGLKSCYATMERANVQLVIVGQQEKAVVASVLMLGKIAEHPEWVAAFFNYKLNSMLDKKKFPPRTFDYFRFNML